MIWYLSVVLLGAQVVQVLWGDLGAQVFLGGLVFRGVLPLTVQGVLEARALWGDLEVPLFLELADLWLDLQY